MSSLSFNVPKNQKLSRAEIVALIRHTLSVLAQPGQTVELRIPGMQGKRTDSGYFNDFDKLAAIAATYENRAEGIYITVNPVQPALLGTQQQPRQGICETDHIGQGCTAPPLDICRF